MHTTGLEFGEISRKQAQSLSLLLFSRWQILVPPASSSCQYLCGLGKARVRQLAGSQRLALRFGNGSESLAPVAFTVRTHHTQPCTGPDVPGMTEPPQSVLLGM